jgi:RNA polymerase sigma-70 factor (ECF subfamily)
MGVEGTLTRRAAFLEGAERTLPTERLEELFQAHHVRLYRLARRLAGDPEEARDLVQEAFVRLARSAALEGATPAGEAWLVRTLVNLCRDRQRRLRVRHRAAGRIEAAAPPAGNPEDAAVARATVDAALARLSPRRRAVIVLRELEGREVSEIARILGLTRVTVRWHLSVARKDLRRILLGEEGGGHAE